MNLFMQLQSEWSTLSTSPTARRTLRHWAIDTPALDCYTDLNHILTTLRRSNPTESTPILNALLHHCPTSMLARRTLVEAFIPTLVSTLRMRKPNANDAEDYLDELFARLLQEVDRTALTAPHQYPGTLINRGILYADRMWVRHQHHIDEPMFIVDDNTPGDVMLNQPEDSLRPTRADRLLATLITAVKDGTISNEDAGFVARTIVNGQPASIEARRRNYSNRAMQQRLHRTIDVIARHHNRNAA